VVVVAGKAHDVTRPRAPAGDDLWARGCPPSFVLVAGRRVVYVKGMRSPPRPPVAQDLSAAVDSALAVPPTLAAVMYLLVGDQLSPPGTPW